MKKLELKSYVVVYDFNGRKYWQTLYAYNKKDVRRKALKYPKIVSIDEQY